MPIKFVLIHILIKRSNEKNRKAKYLSKFTMLKLYWATSQNDLV